MACRVGGMACGCKSLRPGYADGQRQRVREVRVCHGVCESGDDLTSDAASALCGSGASMHLRAVCPCCVVARATPRAVPGARTAAQSRGPRRDRRSAESRDLFARAKGGIEHAKHVSHTVLA